MGHIKSPERREAAEGYLHMVEKRRKAETDPLRQAYWSGYLWGGRYALYGDVVGTPEGHKLLHGIPEDEPDRERREIGRGYRTGFQGEPPAGVLS
jgi:hypothetical protein